MIRKIASVAAKISPIMWMRLRYLIRLKKSLSLKHPQTLNEKILFLSLRSDTSLWTVCADKYAVRDYVRDVGLSNILIPLLGKYDSVDEICLDDLPEEFVIKTNHGCGDVRVIKNERSEKLKQELQVYDRILKEKYGILEGGLHYQRIKPCIIVEKKLENDSDKSSSLIDYKIWCFNGKPEFIFVILNRTKKHMDIMLYDKDWNPHPEYCKFDDHYRQAELIDPPQNLKEMLDYAEILACPFPEVRADFYNIKGKIYFGELTFTSLGGLMTYFSDDFQDLAGSMIKLPVLHTSNTD